MHAPDFAASASACISGCGAEGGAGVAGQPTTQSTNTTASAASQCGVYLSGEDARIFTADGDDVCRSLASDLSSAGTYWSLQAHPAATALGLVCVMTRDGQRLRVEDSGSAIYGRSVCASLLSNRWQEDAAAERSITAAAHEQAQAAAQASAQAQASASVAEQQERDIRAAAGALKQVTSDGSDLGDAVKELRSDVAQADSDLAETKRDAAAGAGDYCSNLATVSSDASGTVASDVTGTVASTVSGTIQPALDGLRSDSLPSAKPSAACRPRTCPLQQDRHPPSCGHAQLPRRPSHRPTG